MGRKKRKKVNALETGKHAGPVAAGRALARLGVGMPGFVPGAVQSALLTLPRVILSAIQWKAGVGD
jgi:hypothetical protein